MSVELPKDAEGREIPLDTEILYDEDGNEYEVARYDYSVRQTIPEHKWDAIMLDAFVHHVSDLYLTQPDSWEKLEDDLSRAINTPKPDNFDSMTCGYFNSVGNDCQECKKKNGFDSNCCNKVAWKDILSRIHNLRGEGE